MVEKTKDSETIAESRTKVQRHIEEKLQPKIVKAWISDYEVKEDGKKIVFEIQSTQSDTTNMEVKTTEGTDISTKAQRLESYTGKPITKPDMYEGTELYQLNLDNGETAFYLPKSKKLAEIVYENSPNQGVMRDLISGQQSFASFILFSIPSVIFMILSVPLGGPRLLLATAIFALIAVIIQTISMIGDGKRQIR